MPTTGLIGFGASAFKPRSFQNLALWLDGSDAGTMYDATTGGSLVSAGSGVARWEDKGPNGWHATQSVGGKRPLRVGAGKNGRDVVRFDGTDDELGLPVGALDAVKGVAGLTAFVVAVNTNTATVSSCNVLYWNTGVGTTRVGFVYQRLTANKVELLGRRLDTDSAGSDVFSTSHGGLWRLVSGVFNYAAATKYGYLDGVQEITNNSFQTAGNTDTTSSTISMVGSAGLSGFFPGDIAEILVYQRALSSGEVKLINNFLKLKWGIL